MEQFTVPCVVYRGGTSRGLFFHETDLPKDKNIRRSIFIKGIGSEDASHINGLGGGTSHTSKVVIVKKSQRYGIDVDYTFVQLGIGSDIVDYEGTCGNLMAAVGAFAVDENLVTVPIDEKDITISVWSTNIDKKLLIHVPLHMGCAKVLGNYSIPGVKEPGEKYLVNVENPGGGKTGKTLVLTEKAKISIDNSDVEYSFVDIVNPFVYVRSRDLSLTGTELNEEVRRNTTLLNKLEEIREQVAVKSGLSSNLEESKNKYTALPKISYVSKPQDYMTSSGEIISKDKFDILARMISMKKMHRTYAVSGLLNLSGACVLKGTIPNEICSINATGEEQIIRIGHPEGVTSIRVKKNMSHEVIDYVGLDRTARRIMSGELYIPSVVK